MPRREREIASKMERAKSYIVKFYGDYSLVENQLISKMRHHLDKRLLIVQDPIQNYSFDLLYQINGQPVIPGGGRHLIIFVLNCNRSDPIPFTIEE